MIIRRGDIFLARIDGDGKVGQADRHVVVVSRDSLNQNSPVVVVVPLMEKAGRRRIYPSQVTIHAGEGSLTSEMVVMGEQVRAISVTRLGAHVGHLGAHTVAEISAVLKIVLDL